jgi:hypothetical protein
MAKMELRFDKVKLKRPQNKRLKDYPEYVEMWAIEAKEMDETVPNNEKPVLWRLLTTHAILNKEDALQCVEWYSQRWMIEELFRVIKSKGMQIESSKLETGAALKKQLVMALQVALTTMTLKMAYDKNHLAKATIVFDQDEIKFIQLLNPTLEGRTQKQKNPFNKDTIAYCSWVLARLCGWSGYASQDRPGYITIKQGLDKFRMKYEGFAMAMNIFNNKEGKE